MRPKTYINVPLDAYSTIHDNIMRLSLQYLYKDHYEELKQDDYHLLEDRDECEKRLKAISRLLAYYMKRTDYKNFIYCINNGKEYVFDPKEYEDD